MNCPGGPSSPEHAALAWAAATRADDAGTYNITNGDVFVWQGAWTARMLPPR